MKKCITLILMLCFFLPVALASEDKAIPASLLDAEGYLQNGEKPFVQIDTEKGNWIYISQNLKIKIQRHHLKNKKEKITWFISEIFARNGERFRAFLDKEIDKKYRYTKSKPEKIAQDYHLVYAQNGDLFTHRVYMDMETGLIIRDRKAIFPKTYNKKVVLNKFPTLDELSLYEDGSMEVRHPGEKKADEYLKDGASDVLSFGPILIRDGVMDERLNGRYLDLEPRSAIGMVKPGHYVGIIVEGRNERSNGSGLKFLAERLLEMGCKNAINLDGGRTAAMIFMGENVMKSGNYKGYTGARNQSEVIGIGTLK